MNRMQLIFNVVNAIAIKKQDAVIEYWLAQAVIREIQNARQGRCATSTLG